jgi:glucokinase
VVSAIPLALAIEIGGTKLQAALGLPGSATLLHKLRRPVAVEQGAAGIRHSLVDMVTALLDSAGYTRTDLQRVSIGFGGPLDAARGVTLTSFQIAGWDDFPLRRWAEERWQTPVKVENDASIAGLAEVRHGSGRGCRRVLYVTLGSGVGGGWIVDGQIDNGQGLGAAEIGHMWLPHPQGGQPVELEQVCSGWAIGQRARAAATQTPTVMTTLAGGLDNIEAKVVYAAAAQGDALANDILTETVETLALALVNTICLLHPERVIIGGGVSLMGSLFWEPLREKVTQRLIPQFTGHTQIVPAALGQDVVLIGALCL